MLPPAAPETIKAMGGTSGRFGRAFRQLRNAPCTWRLIRILIAIQAIPFIWDLINGYPGKLAIAQQFFGLTKPHFLSGKIWQIVTHACIHGNWPHLLLNCACILTLGPKLEHIIVRRSYWLLTLYAALTGGLLFLLFTPASFGNEGPQTLVGSSAICFAFLVLLTTLSPESKFLPLFLSGKSIGIAIILANLILTLLNPSGGPLATYGKILSENGFDELFRISHACHLGGSLAGYIYGKWLLRPRVTLASLRKAREKREAQRDSAN
ncbi:MAG: rhomboid family intramembrane serine protease [Luteolibacter sp.]